MKTSGRLSRPSFWRFWLCCFFLLCLCAASLWADVPLDPAMMTEDQILSELESLLAEQLTTSLERQDSLQNLQTKLQQSQLQLESLQNQLRTLQDGSMTLKSRLSALSLDLDRISTELRDSSSLLLSLGEDIKKESARTRTRETVLISICGVSLGAVLVMLVAGFISR